MMKKSDNDIMKSTDPMATVTTQKQDYIPHSVSRRPFHQPEKYVQPEGEIEGISSYKREYNYKYQDRVQPIRHERKKQELAQFDATTTQKSDYCKWNPVRSKTFAPNRRYERPEEVFEGHSTYNYDFHIHSSQPREPIKPVTNTQFSDDPFCDMTSNRRDYTRHTLPEKVVKPIKEYAPNRIPLDGMTTMKLDYGAKESVKMKSFKPNDNGVQSNEPFDFSTTQKDDFKKWQVQPHFAKKDNEYKQPLGEMDLNTHYNRDFVGTMTAPAKAIRPPTRKRQDAKFEGQTTYEMDFQKLQTPNRREIIKGVSEFQLPNTPFEGESTYKSQFYGSRGMPAKTYKPDLVHVKPVDPFISDTSYRTEYTKKSKN